jgi:small multidrug resistance pump
VIGAYGLLAVAVVAEVSATLALREVARSSSWPLWVLVVVGYGLSFALLWLVLRRLPVGPTYAIWAGVGTAGAVIGGIVFFSERLGAVAIVGILVIVIGVAILEVGRAHG